MLSLSLLTAAHNTLAQKVKTQEFGDAGGERGKWKVSLCWEVCCCWQHVYSFSNWCCMRWCLGISMLCSLVWRSEEPCNVWGRRGPTARNVKMIWKFQPICFHAPGPGVCWPDWSYLEWWSQPHTSCLTTRDLNRACQAPSQSPHCKVCKEVHCRVSPPLLSGDIRLFLPWRDQCDVLGITGLWDWVINKIIWTVIRLSCGPRSFRPHRLAREDQARKRQVTDERLDTKTRSWLCCYLCSVSLVTRIIYDKFPPLVSFCWN